MKTFTNLIGDDQLLNILYHGKEKITQIKYLDKKKETDLTFNTVVLDKVEEKSER